MRVCAFACCREYIVTSALVACHKDNLGKIPIRISRDRIMNNRMID